jgi:hypothetical protein
LIRNRAFTQAYFGLIDRPALEDNSKFGPAKKCWA